MKLIQPLRGIVTAMVTPLKKDGTLDEGGLDRLVEHLIGGGIHGLFILGTTGEAPALCACSRLPWDAATAVRRRNKRSGKCESCIRAVVRGECWVAVSFGRISSQP